MSTRSITLPVVPAGFVDGTGQPCLVCGQAPAGTRKLRPWLMPGSWQGPPLPLGSRVPLLAPLCSRHLRAARLWQIGMLVWICAGVAALVVIATHRGLSGGGFLGSGYGAKTAAGVPALTLLVLSVGIYGIRGKLLDGGLPCGVRRSGPDEVVLTYNVERSGTPSVGR